MTETVKQQIMAVRDSGETNMLDTRMVQYIANREGFYEKTTGRSTCILFLPVRTSNTIFYVHLKTCFLLWSE